MYPGISLLFNYFLNIFTPRGFAFILTAFASLCSQLQSSLIISQLQLWHWVIIHVIADWAYFHTVVPYQAFHYTTSVISFESHTVEMFFTLMLSRRLPPSFTAQYFFWRYPAIQQPSTQYQGFCLRHKRCLNPSSHQRMKENSVYAICHHEVIATDLQEIMLEIQYITLLENNKYQMIPRKWLAL